MKIIPAHEAIRFVLMMLGRPPDRVPRYACYVGAGVSVEAGVKSADAIAKEIHERLLGEIDMSLPNRDAAIAEMEKAIRWNDPSMRYPACIKAEYPDPAMRVAFFRSMLAGVAPSFSHHALALLMQSGYLGRTVVTSNFDKLLESTFARLGGMECQPLRTDEELQYWMRDDRRCYALKLHGDYDTHNVANTPGETAVISPRFEAAVANTLEFSGLLVLGAAGREKSVHTLFDRLTNDESRRRKILQLGVLWGVYMGAGPQPRRPSQAELEEMVEKRVDEVIGRDIQRMIEDLPNGYFFPVWGASTFLYDLIEKTNDRGLIANAKLYLDHEMRIRDGLTRHDRTEATIRRYLGNLRKARRPAGAMPAVAFTAHSPTTSVEVRIAYGDISTRRLMASDEFKNTRRAVVSPEDTFITAGGGVAERLLTKAGRQFMLNEVAKFAPIPHGEVAVTSGGNLPVHYVFHAAALEITDAADVVSKASVHSTIQAALRNAVVLGVGALFVPLMGTGAAGLGAKESFEGILEAVAEWEATAAMPVVIMIFIFDRDTLEKHIAEETMQRVLGSRYRFARP